ncbi:MAG: 5-(carboxyamino)imidazole ribonucleotide synthase, partial [Actinomycetota bacterium]|nr:5-(carboxyamino)imidazole ribonucleotide synthase [Actinomycetota bacterium]
WEGVPAATARACESIAPVYPPPRALDVAQDRIVEKTALNALGIATAPFAAVDSPADLRAALDSIGLPAILKTRRGGYDGKGQALLRDAAGVEDALPNLGDVPCVLEGFVPFDRELSIIAVRGLDGRIAAWPAVENVHRDGILRLTRAPAPGLDDALQARAEAAIRPLLADLDYVGVCCVELFDVGGELLANEIAPRVHNSGHWTIEGAETSQFENHLRAILGLTLGSTAAIGASAMVNCIGSMPDRDAILSVPGAHLHDYMKSARPGRKLGHVTVTAGDPEALEDPLARVWELCDGAGLP